MAALSLLLWQGRQCHMLEGATQHSRICRLNWVFGHSICDKGIWGTSQAWNGNGHLNDELAYWVAVGRWFLWIKLPGGILLCWSISTFLGSVGGFSLACWGLQGEGPMMVGVNAWGPRLNWRQPSFPLQQVFQRELSVCLTNPSPCKLDPQRREKLVSLS